MARPGKAASVAAEAGSVRTHTRRSHQTGEGPPAAEDRVAAPVWARLPEGRDPSGLQGVVVPLPVEEGIPFALEDVVHGETAGIASIVARENLVEVGIHVVFAAVGAPARVRGGLGITKAGGRHGLKLGDAQPASDVGGERAIGEAEGRITSWN